MDLVAIFEIGNPTELGYKDPKSTSTTPNEPNNWWIMLIAAQRAIFEYAADNIGKSPKGYSYLIDTEWCNGTKYDLLLTCNTEGQETNNLIDVKELLRKGKLPTNVEVNTLFKLPRCGSDEFKIMNAYAKTSWTAQKEVDEIRNRIKEAIKT